jgi:hypothetical protein
MIDFLRANTWCSQEQYKWHMTVPQVRLAGMDFSHVEYLSDKEQARQKGNANAIVLDDGKGSDIGFLNDLGIPII